MFAIAVPVNINGERYAISLPGPTDRMKPKVKFLVERLQMARERIEKTWTSSASRA